MTCRELLIASVALAVARPVGAEPPSDERNDERSDERRDERVDGHVDERLDEHLDEHLDERLDERLDEHLGARLARLAEHRYRAGEYYRAISSYEELALFAPDEATRVTSAIRIAMSYHHGEQLADAARSYATALTLTRDPGLQQAIRIQRALARAERSLQDPGSEALDTVAAELQPSSVAGPHRVFALYSLARIHALDGDLHAARTVATQLASVCLQPGPSCSLEPVLARALRQRPPSRRSPVLGLVMSAVVPGAGSVYGGRPVDGLYYFGLTTLAGLGAWEVYDGDRSAGDQQATFYGLAALAAVFYAGSVIQGYVSVARYNAVVTDTHRRALWRDTDQPLPLEELVPAP